MSRLHPRAYGIVRPAGFRACMYVSVCVCVYRSIRRPTVALLPLFINHSCITGKVAQRSCSAALSTPATGSLPARSTVAKHERGIIMFCVTYRTRFHETAGNRSFPVWNFNSLIISWIKQKISFKTTIEGDNKIKLELMVLETWRILGKHKNLFVPIDILGWKLIDSFSKTVFPRKLLWGIKKGQLPFSFSAFLVKIKSRQSGQKYWEKSN